MKNFISKLKILLFTFSFFVGVVGFSDVSQAKIIWGDALVQQVDCESVNFLATCGQIELHPPDFYPPIFPYTDNDSDFEGVRVLTKASSNQFLPKP